MNATYTKIIDVKLDESEFVVGITSPNLIDVNITNSLLGITASNPIPVSLSENLTIIEPIDVNLLEVNFKFLLALKVLQYHWASPHQINHHSLLNFGDNAVCFHITEPPVYKLNNGDTIGVKLNDDFTGLITHKFLVKGYY